MISVSGMRRYTMWAPTRGSAYVSRDPPGRGWKEDRRSWCRLTVRAHSVRQALYVAGNWIRADEDGVGIVEVREPVEGVRAGV